MAGSGGGAAYAQLKKPDDGISQGLQFWGAQQNQSNEKALDRIAEKERQSSALSAQQKEAERKELVAWEEKYGNISDFKQSLSGVKDFDEIGRKYTNKVIDSYIQAHSEATEARDRGDTKKKSELEFKMQTYKNSFSKINDIAKSVAERVEAYNKLVASGKSSGLNKGGFEPQLFNAIQGRDMDITIDEKGYPTMRGIANEKPYEISWSSFNDGSWHAVEKQDVPTLISSFSKIIGDMEEIDATGKIITDQKVWSDEVQGKAVKALMDSSFLNPDVIGDLLNQFTKGESMKTSGFTKEEEDLVKNKMTELVKGAYDQKTKKSINKDLENVLLNKQKANESARHNRATESNTQRGQNVASADRQKKMQMDYNKDVIKTRDLPDLNISKPKDYNVTLSSVKGADGKPTKLRLPFQTYTMADKQGKKIPFVVSREVDKKGKTQYITAESIQIAKNTSKTKDGRDYDNPVMIINFSDGRDKTITRASKPQEFDNLANLLGNKDITEVDINNLGSGDNTSEKSTTTSVKTSESTAKKEKLDWGQK